jgi:pectinesterase
MITTMYGTRLILTYFLFHFWFLYSLGLSGIDAIVAKDGSGDFATIQEAINAAPLSGVKPYVIFIRKGIYEEKLYFEKSFITLLGEDRDSAQIVCAELRSIWRAAHNNDDWGASTINIRTEVTDLTFANLTILNNFAEIYPDYPTKNDHTFAIRGGGNRIIIINCNIISTGGDTLSLWNTSGGMYYHNGCYFEGYVDYVCPRGYCYITNCNFFGHNNNASIWHDGSGGIDQKLVVTNSVFDGVQGFALGRYHKDAAFYLLNCEFSSKINNNGGIIFVGSSPLNWGERVYYYNCHKIGGDYQWHKNNLTLADSNLKSAFITPLWVYKNSWDPESKIAGLLPMAFLPSPNNLETGVSKEPALTWLPGRNSKLHNVYFGKTNHPEFVGSCNEPLYKPSKLDGFTMYYWRIDEINENDTIIGKIWKFTTVNDKLPKQAYYPVPADNSTDNYCSLLLKWENDSEILKFIVNSNQPVH